MGCLDHSIDNSEQFWMTQVITVNILDNRQLIAKHYENKSKFEQIGVEMTADEDFVAGQSDTGSANVGIGLYISVQSTLSIT